MGDKLLLLLAGFVADEGVGGVGLDRGCRGRIKEKEGAFSD